jgi:hypothetical protein
MDLTERTLPELLQLQTAITAELRRRGAIRTGVAIGAELMERAVAEAYGGTLPPPGTKSWDVLAADGRRIQVKTRTLAVDARRHFPFHDLEFDLAVVVHLDVKDLSILWAAELSRELSVALAKPHAQDVWRIRMTAARREGTDVTELLRAAYAAIG